MEDNVYNYSNKGWKSTCKVLLGEELGELKDFKTWLVEYVAPVRTEKSAISGKTVSLAIPDYAKNAKFISFDEIEPSKRFEPLNINEIKDIDSLIEAVQERMSYAGNVILGNSAFVENSSNVLDSRYIYNCSTITSDSKYIAYCDSTRESEFEFGCYSCGDGSHNIKCTELFGGKRCFESHGIHLSSDTYYSYSLKNCSEALFSFGVLSKRHIIGNLELPKDRYYAIKQKILSEIAERMKKEKGIFSLLKIIENAGTYTERMDVVIEQTAEKQKQFDKTKIDAAFVSTTALLFGKKLELDSCEALLKKHVPQNIYLKSPITGKETIVAAFMTRHFDRYNIGNRTLPENEMRMIGKKTLPLEKIDQLRMDVDALSKQLAPIAFACFDGKVGNNTNIAKIALIADSESCYIGSAYISSKKCAQNYWPKECDCVFGSSAVWYSAFCINCYWSKRLQRSFGVDSSENCSGGYFLHNCENVHDSMFCFNVKNLRNAIGNAALPLDKYKKTRTCLVEQIADELRKKGNLECSIYSIGKTVPKR